MGLKQMQSAQNPISTVHNEESRVMNIPAKFQLNRTTNAQSVDQDWTENSINSIFFLSIFGGSSSFFFFLIFLISVVLLAAAKDRVIKPYSPKWAILYLGGKPNPTNLPLPD
jgi:hypothetical protein